MSIGELLGALSIATDLAVDHPPETALRTCVLATRVAERIGLRAIGEIRRVALLRHLGCTAYAHEQAALTGGDDHDVMRAYMGVDRGRFGAVAARTMTRLARQESLGRRIATIARLATHTGAAAELVAAQCAQAVALAQDLGLAPGIVIALAQIYERFDGRGTPLGLAGDAIAVSARVCHLVEVVEVYHRVAGRDAAIAEVRRRRGRHLDPQLADAVLAEPDAWWPILETESIWDDYLADEDPREPMASIEDVARAFGRFADLKSTYRLGHSTGVAELASRALDDGTAAERIRLAALLHDLGTVSVPNGIWDKRGRLTTAEWERVRLHAYVTERILVRSPVLAELAPIAGAHHEHLDGSGYHRGTRSSMLDRAARTLAAADAYRAMREARPYRDAMTPDQAADALLAEVRAGKLCTRAVDAVLGAAGHALVGGGGVDRPAGLTEREVEVLVQLARGRTNKEIAHALGIALRTTNHHVENIYAKIGVATRAAAALFAVRHDLVQAEVLS